MPTTQKFNCQNEKCKQVSTVHMVEHYNGVYFVVCEHCGERNEIVIVLGNQGEQLKLTAVGLV